MELMVNLGCLSILLLLEEAKKLIMDFTVVFYCD